MHDREKVIKGLECCKEGGSCDGCQFDIQSSKCIFLLHEAVLALLKEQEKPNGKCVNECECWDSAYERGKQDALKEQEAVKPTWSRGNPFCGACGLRIRNDGKFCSECGRPVLWEGR